jgi:hypothetical protein
MFLSMWNPDWRQQPPGWNWSPLSYSFIGIWSQTATHCCRHRYLSFSFWTWVKSMTLSVLGVSSSLSPASSPPFDDSNLRYIGEQVTFMLYGLSVLQAWLFFQRWKEQAIYLKCMVNRFAIPILSPAILIKLFRILPRFSCSCMEIFHTWRRFWHRLTVTTGSPRPLMSLFSLMAYIIISYPRSVTQRGLLKLYGNV